MTRQKIAFIAHPLNLSSLSVITGFPKWAFSLAGASRAKSMLLKVKPFVFCSIEGIRSKTGREIDLIGVSCPLLPEQMAGNPTKFVINRIKEAVDLAAQKGARMAVLGGFTSVIGNEGQDIQKLVKIPVTSGNTYTAALAIFGVERAAKLVELDLSKAKCAVIGATGDIGSACARHFASKVADLSCCARDEEKLVSFSNELKRNGLAQISIHRKVSEAVSSADIIISATSALTTIIDVNALKPGAIVCDVALPANIAREVSRVRPDVLVFEGGLSTVPNIDKIKNKKWDLLMPHNAIYGCLAEGIILGLENRFESYSIGRGMISTHKIMEIMMIAKKHGFDESEFFCGDRFYSNEDLIRIKRSRVNGANNTEERISNVA